MSKLEKDRCEEFNLYFYDKKYLALLKKVISKDYSIDKSLMLKKTADTQVIIINKKKYVLKEIYKLPFIKKFLSLFRKSQCLEVLINTHKYISKGFDEIGIVYGVGEERTLFVKKQFLLMEYIEGRILNFSTDFERLEEFLIRLHKSHAYHGDVHERNFLIDENNRLRALDTRLKSNIIANIGGHLDMHKFRRTFGEQSPYPYKKNLLYYYCQIREKKKKIVDKIKALF